MRTLKYLSKRFLTRKHPGIKFFELFGRIQAENMRMFLERDVNIEKSRDLVSKTEMLLMVDLMRSLNKDEALAYRRKFGYPAGVNIEHVQENGVDGEFHVPENERPGKVVLYFHGGAGALCSVVDHRNFTMAIAKRTNVRVFSITYGLAPERPFPEGLTDCVNAYKWLLSKGYEPGSVIIAGDSMGGNLTLASMLKLKEEGIQLPAGGMLFSPGTDYGISDLSVFDRAKKDPILADINLFWMIHAYVGGNDLKNPLISPVFGDYAGFPPLLVQVSTCEMLYSDSTRVADRARVAKVDVTFQEWDDMIHAFQWIGIHSGWPEIEDSLGKIAAFVARILG